MKTDFAQPVLAMGSDVVWIDAATPDPLKKDEILTISQMAAGLVVACMACKWNIGVATASAAAINTGRYSG